MPREYPDWISPIRAAEGKRIFSGTIQLSRMKRLAALLVDAGSEASFTVAFGFDLDRRIVIALHVEAALPLICQASLEVYDELVNRDTELVVVDDENELDELPEHYEPVMTENGSLAIVSLVEDELLLSLPQFPRKPGLPRFEYSTGEQTAESEDGKTGARKNPFAALQGILKTEK